MRAKAAVLLVPLVLVVAGCASTEHSAAAALDTGMIAPGAEATLTFDAAGMRALHCDPHPFMTHNVTVEAGAAATAHVHISDGNDTADFRFEPQALRVAPGAVVTYHNHGTLGHTASEMTAAMQH